MLARVVHLAGLWFAMLSLVAVIVWPVNGEREDTTNIQTRHSEVLFVTGEIDRHTRVTFPLFSERINIINARANYGKAAAVLKSEQFPYRNFCGFPPCDIPGPRVVPTNFAG